MASRSKDIYREAGRRSHRILGNYLALRGWAKRVDCLIIDRTGLLPYFGVGAMREKRLDWLAQDLKDVFPYVESLYFGYGAYAGIYLSRRKFPAGAFDDRMLDKLRLQLLRRQGIRASVLKVPDERRMTAFLAIAATGG